MHDGFDPGALLAASYALAGGTRVRLRLAASSDAEGIRQLGRAGGDPSPELVAARLIRADPRRYAVVCASALIDGVERLIGVGMIDLHGPGLAPERLLLAQDAPAGLRGLLSGALVGRARALGRHRHAA